MGRKFTLYFFLVLLWPVLPACTTTHQSVFGLQPEYPEVLFSQGKIVFVEIDSLQPTFKWESFPRPKDIEADREGLLGQISEVTYDLKVWHAEGLIYSREGLPDPYHKFERVLPPSHNFIWTIRARFKLDGQPRVTEWGMSQYPQRISRKKYGPSIRRSRVIPNPNYYRFKTPAR